MKIEMRNIFIKLLKSSICAAVMSIFVMSCDDMNSINQKYYDRGEMIYTGIVDSITVYPGYYKIAFDWQINADPRISKVLIYWNNRADSVVVPVQRTEYKVDSMYYMINDIPEGNYIFEFITRDDEGHRSLFKEATAVVYGEEYCKTLRNRTISSIKKRSDGSMEITWNDVSSSYIQYTIVEYTVNGITQTVRVENSDQTTIISGPKTGETINVSSVYLYENAIDELTAAKRSYVLPRYSAALDKSKFSVVVLPGDNTTNSKNRPLQKIWDGTPKGNNILHTVLNAPEFNFPHYFTFDIGVLAELHSFTIWPRVDVSPFTGHSPESYELWACKELTNTTDTEYYTSSSWKNDWTMIVSNTITKPLTTDEQKEEWNAGWVSEIQEGLGRFRYLRLIVKSNWGKENCVNIGEITIVGDDTEE